MTEQVIVIDTRTLVTLAAQPSAGSTHSLTPTQRLDTLLQSGQRIIITQDVYDEMQFAPQSADFNAWYEQHHITDGTGQIYTPDFQIDPTITSQRGDISIREWAAQDTGFDSRFLSDEMGMYSFEENRTGGFDAAMTSAR